MKKENVRFIVNIEPDCYADIDHIEWWLTLANIPTSLNIKTIKIYSNDGLEDYQFIEELDFWTPETFNKLFQYNLFESGVYEYKLENFFAVLCLHNDIKLVEYLRDIFSVEISIDTQKEFIKYVKELYSAYKEDKNQDADTNECIHYLETYKEPCRQKYYALCDIKRFNNRYLYMEKDCESYRYVDLNTVEPYDPLRIKLGYNAENDLLCYPMHKLPRVFGRDQIKINDSDKDSIALIELTATRYSNITEECDYTLMNRFNVTNIVKLFSIIGIKLLLQNGYDVAENDCSLFQLVSKYASLDCLKELLFTEKVNIYAGDCFAFRCGSTENIEHLKYIDKVTTKAKELNSSISEESIDKLIEVIKDSTKQITSSLDSFRDELSNIAIKQRKE